MIDKSTLECGSLLPLFVRQLAAVFTVTLSDRDASKLATKSGSKLPHSKD